MLLMLNKSYLVNMVKLEMQFFNQRSSTASSHPTSSSNLVCMPEDQVDGMKITFTLKSSQNNSSWITLANYEELDCLGEIVLTFPTQSVR